MKKQLIALAFSAVGITTLNAQDPRYDPGQSSRFESVEGFTFVTTTNGAELKIGAEVYDLCTPFSRYLYETNRQVHWFDKPISAPAFGPLRFGENLVFNLSPPYNHNCPVIPPLGNVHFNVDNVPKLTIQGSDGSVRVNHTIGYDWSYAFQVNVDRDLTKAFTVVNTAISQNNGEVFKIYGNGTVQAKKVYAEEIEVSTSSWNDHVFGQNYKLRPLSELEVFVKENKHLPEIPSEKEVKENGINVGEMQGKLLLKIEELTLYIIALEKRLSELEAKTKEGGK